MPSVRLSKLQREYFKQLATEKNRIERDLVIAVGVAMAGAGIDYVKGMSFGFDGDQLIYETPET